MESSQTTTEDQRETDKFNRLAVQWWDPQGLMWPLHRLNDMRAPFVIEKIQQHFKTVSLKGLRILDIGCGAGLLAERMAKQGATVTGIDVAAKNIAALLKRLRMLVTSMLCLTWKLLSTSAICRYLCHEPAI